MAAAEAFALRHGEPGTSAYRAAWLQARRRGLPSEASPPGRSDPPAVGNDVIALLTLAIKRAMRIDGGSMATAQVVDPQTRALRIVAHTGFPSEFIDFFERVERTANASCASALANASTVWVADTSRSPIFAGSPALGVMLGAGSRGVASVPVISPDEDVIAVISTHHRRPASWTCQQQLALERLARTTGRVLHALRPPAVARVPQVD